MINPEMLSWDQYKLQVQLRDPSHHDQDGVLIIPPDAFTWKDIQFIELGSGTACEHQVTVCSHCIESWDQDYKLRFVPREGHTGQTYDVDELRER